MRYLFVLFFLVGCGEGYAVSPITISKSCRTQYINKFVCEKTKPIFYFDNNIAICDTKEECFKICERHRGLELK